MKELRSGESSTAARPLPGSHLVPQEKLMRDQENRLQHLVSTGVPSPPYPGIAILTPSVLFGMDPASAMLSAHLFASLAATNPNGRYQFPIPISLGVQAPGTPVFPQHHGASAAGGNVNVGHLPNVAHPNANLDILSSWIQKEHGGKQAEDRKISAGGGCNVKTGSKKQRDTNWSVTKSNKNSRKGASHNGKTASENVINSRKTAELQLPNNDSDIDIKPTIIPTEDETGYKGGLVKKQRIDDGDEDEELMTQHKNNNNSITTNNNHNHNSMGSMAQQQSNQQFRDKIFTCPICSRCFGYKHVLQNHERTHTGEKPFECNICQKKFTRDHHLKTHMRLHTGEKPYKCTHCDRQFVQVANLRRHLRVHTGERPYACDLCPQRFSDSNQLKAHMLIHKGEKPYSCKDCGGRFRRRHHLVHHKCNNNKDSNKLSPDPDLQSPLHHHFESSDDISPTNAMKRERKPRETRRIIRLPGLPVATVTTAQSPIHDNYISVGPEQTVPEDLSLGNSALRSRRYSGSHSSCSVSPSPPSGESHGSLDAYCRSITSSDPPENSSDDEHLEA